MMGFSSFPRHKFLDSPIRPPRGQLLGLGLSAIGKDELPKPIDIAVSTVMEMDVSRQETFCQHVC
jgi:hypothetical protein